MPPPITVIDLSSGDEADAPARVKHEPKREPASTPATADIPAPPKVPTSAPEPTSAPDPSPTPAEHARTPSPAPCDRLAHLRAEIAQLERMLARARDQYDECYAHALAAAQRENAALRAAQRAVKDDARTARLRASGFGQMSRAMVREAAGRPARESEPEGDARAHKSEPEAGARAAPGSSSRPARAGDTRASAGRTVGFAGDSRRNGHRADVRTPRPAGAARTSASQRDEMRTAVDVDSDVPLFAGGAASDSDAGDSDGDGDTAGAHVDIEDAIRALAPAAGALAGMPAGPHATWERKLMTQVLGGGIQNSWPAPDKHKAFPYTIAGDKYICIKANLNAWLPRAPGAPGALTVFRTGLVAPGAVYPLFVHVDGSQWRYMGNYTARDLPARGGPLPVAQWRRHFTDAQKHDWCKHILGKLWGRQLLRDRGILSADEFALDKDILRTYEPGTLIKYFELGDDDPKHLRLQVRLLQPHSFDRALYDMLGEFRQKNAEKRGAGAEKRAVKRAPRRVAGSSDEEDEPPHPADNADDAAAAAHNSDADSDSARRRATPKKPKSTRKPRRSSGFPRLPTSWEELLDTVPIDEDTLLPYELPAATDAPSARSAVKRERSGSADGGAARAAPRARRSVSVELVANPVAWRAPTAWHDAIDASATPDRKAFAHELIQSWPPLVFADHAAPVAPARFSRKFLSAVLGGCEQTPVCDISAAKAARNNHRLRRYHAVDPRWDPYGPARPGAHGLTYRIDEGAYGAAPRVPVFCKRRKNEWEYCGEYEFCARPFMPGEWEQLPQTTKDSWVDGLSSTGRHTQTKWGREHMEYHGFVRPGEDITPSEVLQIMDSGQIKMKAITAECQGYNWKLHNWLAVKWEAWTAERGVKVKTEDDDDGAAGLE